MSQFKDPKTCKSKWVIYLNSEGVNDNTYRTSWCDSSPAVYGLGCEHKKKSNYINGQSKTFDQISFYLSYPMSYES